MNEEETDPQEDPAEDAPPVAETNAASVDRIEAPVRFSVGSATATLGTLKSLRPGHVFELAERVDEPVDIRVNGVSIGRGELVRIGDRTGVRVVKVYPNGNHSA